MAHHFLIFWCIICLVEGMPKPSAMLNCDEELPNKPVSPFEVNRCLDKRVRSCVSDATKCERDCKFGYQVDDAGCPLQNCPCASGGTFEGDIKFESDDIPFLTRTYTLALRDQAEGAAKDRPKWDEVRFQGRVKIAFELDEKLSLKAKIVIGEAIERYRNSTCIDFIPKTNESDYLVFIREKGCWSFIGRRGGPQFISIGAGCAWTGIVQHEIMHALGFWHEQSRPDRDDYIEVKMENVGEKYVHNFRKRTEIDSLGSKYDKFSIMHYGGYTFSTNGKPTILDKSTGQPVWAQRDDLTKSDVDQVNKMYGCTEKLSKAYWDDWSSWTACSKTCGKGRKTRIRSCMENKSKVPASRCHGKSRQEQDCYVINCPNKGGWSSWHAWTSCSVTCGSGHQLRRRTCRKANCTGDRYQIQNCDNEKCRTGFFSVTVKSLARCENGEIVLSDFNKDGKDDLFCFHPDGWMEVFVSCRTPFSKKFWVGKIADCAGKHHCGDFNGDGFEDILCVEETKGSLHLTLGNGGTYARTSNWHGELNDFCRDGEITAGHITGDQRMDIVCLSNDGNISALVTSLT